MKSTLKNSSICILGMHRSGTSAITRAVNLLGVYLGEPERMIEPLDDNPKGFWEHEGIIKIHDRILSAFSSSWSNIVPLEQGWLEHPLVTEPKKDLTSLLLNDFHDSPLWGWKDPRTCLMLPLWEKASVELDIDIKYLFVIRNPIDVVNSLAKRNNFSKGKSYMLWLLYLLSSLKHTENKKRCIISYEEYLKNWQTCLVKASSSLDIPWPSEEHELKEKMEDFLDTNLRHSCSTLEDVIEKVRSAEIPESILHLYELCKRAEEDMDYLKTDEFNQAINEMYNEHVIKIRMVEPEIRQALKDEYLSEYTHEIEQKNILIKEKDDLIYDITNTLSWRITKPLRWLANFLRQLYKSKEE